MKEPVNEAIELLLEQATQQRDRLIGEVRRIEELALRAQTQGEQLVAYRGEYVERWAGQFGRGGAIEIVQCYQSFMQRLDEAIQQQQRQIEHGTAAAAQLRRSLVDAEIRVATLRKLAERRRQERQRAEERRDQRQCDETAQQLALRRLRGGVAALQH